MELKFQHNRSRLTSCNMKKTGGWPHPAKSGPTPRVPLSPPWGRRGQFHLCPNSAGQHRARGCPFYLKTRVLLISIYIEDVFLSSLAQILTSCGKMNVNSADIRSICQCMEVYFILPTDEKRTHFTSKVLLT